MQIICLLWLINILLILLFRYFLQPKKFHQLIFLTKYSPKNSNNWDWSSLTNPCYPYSPCPRDRLNTPYPILKNICTWEYIRNVSTKKDLEIQFFVNGLVPMIFFIFLIGKCIIISWGAKVSLLVGQTIINNKRF